VRPHTAEPRFLDALTAALEVMEQEGIAAGAQALVPIAFAPADALKRPTLNIATRARIFQRDRFTCRYCGLRTVPEPIFELLGVIYPTLIPFHSNWKGGAIHPVEPLVIAEPDHIKPGRRGGDWLDEDNLATSCAACNTLKADYLLDELGWPLLPIPETTWDGLTGHYRTLWKAASEPRTSGDRHGKWMQAFGV